MMKEEETYSWIFLATAMSCQNGASSLKAISKVADGINHAVPTQKEIQFSMKWLINNGLIVKEGKKFDLTLTGKTIYLQASESSNGMTKNWDYLTKYFLRLIKGKDYLPEFSKELYLIIVNGYDKKHTRKIIKLLSKLNQIHDSDNNMSSRLIAALLKLSDSSFDKLEEAIRICKIDWRDTLMSSGFGNDVNEHKKWISEQMANIDYDNPMNNSSGLLIL